MPKIGSTSLSLLAVFALSAILSTTASANTSHVFLIEGTELGAGSNPSTEAVEGTAGLSVQKFETKVAGVTIVKECEEDIGTAEIKKGGQSVGRAEGKNCYLYEKDQKGKQSFLTACALEEPILFKFTGELIGSGVGKTQGEGGEEVLSEIKIKGESCSLKGTYKILGSQLCSGPESGFEKVTHEAKCTPAGGKLRFGNEQSQLFGNGIAKLKSGKRWSST